jgi:hypothetical protein
MKIKELQERYGLKTRQSIYDWIKAAKRRSNGEADTTRKVASFFLLYKAFAGSTCTVLHP